MLKLYNNEGKEIRNECTEFCSNPSYANNKMREITKQWRRNEQNYDRLFLECCQQEKETDISVPPLCATTSNPRFAPPKTDKEVE